MRFPIRKQAFKYYIVSVLPPAMMVAPLLPKRGR